MGWGWVISKKILHNNKNKKNRGKNSCKESHGKKIEQMLSTIIILIFNVKKILPPAIAHQGKTFMYQKTVPFPPRNTMVRLLRRRLKRIYMHLQPRNAHGTGMVTSSAGELDTIFKKIEKGRLQVCTRIKSLTLHLLLNIGRSLLVLSVYSLCIVEYGFLCLPHQNIRLSFISFTHYNLTSFTIDILFQLLFSYLQLLGIINVYLYAASY